MTAISSQKLADALRLAGFEDLAGNAEADLYHDFLSPLDVPAMVLDRELVRIIQTAKGAKKFAAEQLRARHHNGEFDAGKEESDAWADSHDGQETLNRLVSEKRIGDGPVEAEFAAIMRGLAEGLDEALNGDRRPRINGFVLLVFSFGDGGRANYVSNAEREDVLRLLKEQVKRFEETIPQEQSQ